MLAQQRWRLLFGLEGVAIDPAQATLAALKEGLQQIGRPLPPEVSLDWLMQMELEEALQYLLGSDHEHLGTSVAKQIGLHYKEFRRFKGRLYTGIAELLGTLTHQQEVETILLSPWQPEETRRQLTSHGLVDGIDLLACRHAHGCLGCRRKIAIDTANRATPSDGQLVWLTDEPKDILTAHRHGILSIAALWGHTSQEELKAVRPSLWAVEPQDVTIHLRQPTIRLTANSAEPTIQMH